MRRIRTQQILRNALLFVGLISFMTFQSCKDDDPIIEDPIATFQFEISSENYLQVIFTNFSSNASTYAWNFGDGQTSTEKDPVHTYAEAGAYNVQLTATNSAGVSHSFTQSIEIKDPDEALALLAGETSKTWRLYRVGSSMGVGPNAAGARSWWALENDGKRPCVYYHEFTFNRQGQFIFDDKGSFWGEEAVFAAPLAATCFEATASNMVNKDGADVSAWLSGTHQFTYEPAINKITLNGVGAWMGLPQLGTAAESIVPEATRSFNAVIEQFEGYDLLTISYAYADLYWDFTYASYSNPALEPDVETEEEPFGEDLPNITPTQMGHTFESESSFVLLGAISGASVITPGADDPADASATKVGKFDRTEAQYQEAILRVAPDPKDIQYDNFTTVSIDVYLPSTNTYDPLTQKVIIGFADLSQTEQWWTRIIQYESDELALDQWVTVTFNLDTPSFSSTDGQTVYDRDDLDMVFIQIGGGDHTSPGVFYIRNLIFE
ncbi:MAG: PKD domain-containing protein [Bacteroidales bacterium]